MAEPSWNWTLETAIPSVRGAGVAVLEQLLEHLHKEKWQERAVFGVHLAVEEALVNAIVHGNRLDSGKQVHVSFKVAPDRLFVQITDEGPGFSPERVPDCTCEENLGLPG